MGGPNEAWAAEAQRLLLQHRQCYSFEAERRSQRRLVRYDPRLHETYHVSLQIVTLMQRPMVALATKITDVIVRAPTKFPGSEPLPIEVGLAASFCTARLIFELVLHSFAGQLPHPFRRFEVPWTPS
ncbi:unnamed protein product [Prorocentrum cordatum]|uniref:Uncharacterized protein n=1 Tax=Prorocentrum cordatum TaxID=2364126 RepID=A0ABN9SWV8_9DINO|nr:unnamed protein product [Polarella glacialis]